ncbi:MAG TPA: IS66 family insertion sequence element accessory protein TnpB [Polyangiaceae bacterium]|jgi:transposase|nr:IS66 family insertion sequence element accessory protein TnpB [Polyangiaceae bacterium]
MLPAKMPIYCATTPVDLRRSFDGLAASAKEALGKDPRSGALFLFVNKAGNRLKALWWDRTGYCLLYKRLERGVFRFPSAMRPGDMSVTIEAAEFAKILEGLDLSRASSDIGIVRRTKAASEEIAGAT